MTNSIKTWAASLLLLTTNTLFATNYYVDASKANDNGAGTTEATAKKTLQAIVNNVVLKGSTLYVELTSSVLREELSHGKSKIVAMINEELRRDVVKDVVLR